MRFDRNDTLLLVIDMQERLFSAMPNWRAISAAVNGWSPVIITVRMPISRSSSKRSRMPGFTMSLR